MKKVLKYATGEKIPRGAIYLATLKNGKVKGIDYSFVWHYFLIEVKK